MAKDLALVVGAATLKDLGSTYRNASVDRSALDRLMELTAGVRVSAHVPAPATNRQDAVIRRGMSTTATAPVWEGVTIIPDEVTKAKAGQIVITAVMLFAMKVLRTGAGPFPLIWDWDRKPPASLVELVSVASQEVYAACGFQHGPMGRLSGGLSPGSMAAGLIRCAITVGAAGGKRAAGEARGHRDAILARAKGLRPERSGPGLSKHGGRRHGGS